mmetsp:Transcript_4739/g.5502  ORF Transcript_4739/g.5502 Transcript_4739/m.5502 type:complete len:488 (+) Transcript_4739:337-1800(+)
METFTGKRGRDKTGEKDSESWSDRKKTSLEVFKQNISRTIEKDEQGNIQTKIDASGILTPKCFNEWLNTRVSMPKHPEGSFRRTLTAHVRGSDQRSPFSPEEEVAILKLLRGPYPFEKVFENSNNDSNVNKSIGRNGFRSLGYHEKRSGKFGDNLFKKKLHIRNVKNPASSTVETNVDIANGNTNGAFVNGFNENENVNEEHFEIPSFEFKELDVRHRVNYSNSSLGLINNVFDEHRYRNGEILYNTNHQSINSPDAVDFSTLDDTETESELHTSSDDSSDIRQYLGNEKGSMNQRYGGSGTGIHANTGQIQQCTSPNDFEATLCTLLHTKAQADQNADRLQPCQRRRPEEEKARIKRKKVVNIRRQLGALISVVSQPSENAAILRRAFMPFLSQLSKAQLGKIFGSFDAYGQFLSPSSVSSLCMALGSNDIRCSLEFLMPKNMSFVNDLPVGRCLLDLRRGQVVVSKLLFIRFIILQIIHLGNVAT